MGRLKKCKNRALEIASKGYDEKVRRVRTPEGARIYGQPIGTVIKPGGKVDMPDVDMPNINSPKPRKNRGSKAGKPDTSVRKASDFSVTNSAEELKKISRDGQKDAPGTPEEPIDVGTDVEKAAKLLAEGKHIRMSDEKSVSTLITKLNEIVQDAKTKGDKAPEYDLCNVSVPKTNLFCVESKGVPRVNMPQFKGEAVDGSFAEGKKNDKGEADVEPEFMELLKELGIKVTDKRVKADELKASQENLDGAKVAGMTQAFRDGKIKEAPIFVTKDGYILDGHHRWAALVSLDLDDGVSGDIEMPVMEIDIEIGYAIDLANGFTEMAGIKRKGLGAAADGVKRMFIGDDCTPCAEMKRLYSEESRMEMAKEGMAMEDGSYPIKDEADLKNAIQAYGRAKDKEATKKHIIKRAKELNLEDLIPAEWMGEEKMNLAELSLVQQELKSLRVVLD